MASENCPYCLPAADEALALHLHGIQRVPAAIYFVAGYRYSSLVDAVAQARRNAAREAYLAR